MIGALLEVQFDKICTTPARANDSEVKIVKTPGARDVFWSWKCVSRGRRRDFDTLQNTWQAQEFVRVAKTLAGVVDLKRLRNDAFRVAGAGISCFLMSMFTLPLTQNPWKGCKFHVMEVLLCSDHFAWQLQDFVCLGSTFSWQPQYFWSIHLKIAKTYCNSEVKCLVDMSFLKEVSQKSFVFDLQRFIFEGSLAEKLRFGASKLQFWRKSRRKASFLSFEISILKEVSHKSFVFDLQSFNFEGSLAEMLGFWSSKLRFWRKSRRKASLLSFKASILKEVSQKSFVWQNNLNHTSVDNQLTWTSNHLTAKSLESQINWQPTHLNLRSIDNQFTGIRNQLTNKINRIAHRLTTKSLESQINWEPTLESRIDWQPNHLNLKAIDNQINWISDQLTTSSLESQINWQPNSFEAHIDWQPNHLNLKSVDNQITWISNHSTSKSLEFRINRQPNDLNPKSIDNQNHLNLTSLQSDFNWLSNQLNPARPPSYRFLIFGNFRHRLVR